ncbi:DUF4184 family protein [Streptomyces sp. NPDC004539]|uniref:DUF4184 family protein n=1 Tax=Streptomyces sp. NPDC004539 TaxID=3154280 RepID=UPI0033AA158F
MPFTLSHPAAVLPLLRRPFGRTALVAGAVAPDMPYFVGVLGLPVGAQSWYEPFLNATTTHGVPGALTVSLPYALALWLLARTAHRPLASLLPLPTPAPRPRTGGATTRRAAWTVLSAVIGIATHLLWDAFTHHDGFVVAHTPWLTSPMIGGLTWARALQHLSTVGGLAAIGVYAWRRRAALQGGDLGTARRRALFAVAGVAVVGAVAHAWWWLAGPQAPGGLSAGEVVEGALSDAAKGAGAVLIGVLALYVVAWWGRRAVVRGV